jgi:hypothetical protein
VHWHSCDSKKRYDEIHGIDEGKIGSLTRINCRMQLSERNIVEKSNSMQLSVNKSLEKIERLQRYSKERRERISH